LISLLGFLQNIFPSLLCVDGLSDSLITVESSTDWQMCCIA
jgi:hypothetical protein